MPSQNEAGNERPDKFALHEGDHYKLQLKELEEHGLLPYLADLEPVKERLRKGRPMPPASCDHALQRPPLKGLRSVVVGRDKGSDISFILIYRPAGNRIDLLFIEQHDDAYAIASQMI